MISAGVEPTPLGAVGAVVRGLLLIAGLTGLALASLVVWREWRAGPASERSPERSGAAPALAVDGLDLGLTARPLPPHIEFTTSPAACSSTASPTTAMAEPLYPMIAGELDDVTSVSWWIDTAPLGTAVEPPYLPRDADALPVALPELAELAGEPAPTTTVGPEASGPPQSVVPDPTAAPAEAAGPDPTAVPETTLASSTTTLPSTAVLPDPTDPPETTVPVEPPGPRVIAVVTFANETTLELRSPLPVPTSPAAAPLRWRADDGRDLDLIDWQLRAGAGRFVDAAGLPIAVQLDGTEVMAGVPVDLDRLEPGRHTITSAASPAPLTVVTLAGRTAPEVCAPLAVTEYGAIPDDAIDDSAAVIATLDVAMATGARATVPAGVFLIEALEDVVVARSLILEGVPGAVFDAGRARKKYPMLDVMANVELRGLEVRSAGRVLAFDHLTDEIDRVTVAASTFRDVYSPAHLSDPPPGSIGVITIVDTVVERASKGYLLPLTRFDHARVRGNTLSDIETAAIRLGADIVETFAAQRDVDVRANTVSRVTGTSDANGIKVMGTGAVIVDNSVTEVRSADLSDSEGIYTKGSGHLIARNVLIDAGATQAQITVKSDQTSVVDNQITTVAAPTNGIRLEGSDLVVSGNRITGGGPESFAITTKLTEGFGNYLIVGNVISATSGTGISAGGDGPIEIVGNTFEDVTGMAAIEVFTSRADTVGVVIRNNTADDLTHERSRFVALTVRNQRMMSEVEIRDNTVAGSVNAIVFYRTAGSTIRAVTVAGNDWGATRSAPILGADQVEDLILA